MNTLTTLDFQTPEKISLAGGALEQEEDKLELTLESYSLSARENDSFKTAGLVYPVAAGAALSPAPASASSGSNTWAWGIKVSGGKVRSGYYDVNKKFNKKDSELCWAAVASNLLAKWQKGYSVSSRIGTKVPTTAAAIFKRFQYYWKNDGGSAEHAIAWYLAGSSTHSSFRSFYNSTIRKKYQSKTTAGYYKSFYTASTANSLSTYSSAITYGADSSQALASNLHTRLKEKSLIGLSIAKRQSGTNYLQSSGHAITLWGIKRNASGRLSHIYVTDSDDRKNGVITYKLSYNSTMSLYRITNGVLKNYYIRGYNTLKVFSFKNFSTPSKARVSQKGTYVTFRWKNRSSQGSITHQVGYRRKGTSAFTYLTTSRQSLKVKLDADGKYEWRVRTKVAKTYASITVNAYTSDWVKSSFTFTGAPPKVTFYKMTQKKVSASKTRIGIRWKANERATFVLYLDGKRVYKGTGKTVSRRYFTVKNGTHTYKLVARDKNGSKSYKSGTLSCGVSKTNNNQNTNNNTTNNTSSSLTLSVPTPSVAKTSYNSKMTTVTFTWSCNKFATFTLKLDGKTIYTGNGSYYIRSDYLTYGKHTYTLTARDSAGNSRSISGTFSTASLASTRASCSPRATQAPSLAAAPASAGAEQQNENAESRTETPRETAAPSAAPSVLDQELALSAGTLTLPGDSAAACSTGSYAASSLPVLAETQEKKLGVLATAV